MQAGFLAEWSSAPFAIEAGAVILVVVGLFFLGPRLRRLANRSPAETCSRANQRIASFVAIQAG